MKIEEKDLKKIEKDYKKGLKYSSIEQKYGLTHNQLIHLIHKNKWKRKSNRSEVQKGNRNSVGNKGGPGAEKGNKRALITGEYESIFKDVLDEEELEIFNKYEVEDKIKELKNEIKVLTIRERRMLQRIESVKQNTKRLKLSILHQESSLEKIQRIEDAVTRVQESKRRAIESLHKFELDDNRFELELLRLERQVAADEPEDPSAENDKTSNLIDALNLKASEVWVDAEN